MSLQRLTLYRFTCDSCGKVAGESEYEDEAKDQMLSKVRFGWELQHPHWGLRCAACLAREAKP